MPFHLKIRLPLFIILIAFIACKFHHLYYPYYWDESWSYAPAFHAMYQHGISLLPNAMDPSLSRGHPLLFHAFVTMWADIFGTSHFAMHLFALFISVLLLVAIYEAGLRLFNLRVAVMSVVLLIMQEVFFVQSSFLLPEIQLALFTFLSLCFYVKNKFLLLILSLTALFYTKESGMVLGVVLLTDASITLFKKKEEWKLRVCRLVSVIIPCVLIAVFFLLQKHTTGWYVFPEHIHLVDYTWGAFWIKFRMSCIRFAFYDYNRYWYYLVLLIIALIAAIKNKKLWYAIIFIPAIIIYYFVDNMRAERLLLPIPFFVVFILSVFLLLYIYGSKGFNTYQRKLILLIGVFVLCFFSFSAINFFTSRYLLCSMVLLSFLMGAYLDMLISRSYKFLYYLAVFCVLIISFFSFKNNNGNGDIEMGAFDAMDVQQDEVNFFEKNNDYDKAIWDKSLLGMEHLTNPATGFLHTDKIFNKARSGVDWNADFVVFDNLVTTPIEYNTIKKDSSFYLIHRFQKGRLWSEIYARK